VKKCLILISILFIAVIGYSEEQLSVTILEFNISSNTGEKIDFLDTKVSEIMESYLNKNKPKEFTIDLAWVRSKEISDWKAKTELSAYENGKILKTDFVIYGNVTLNVKGYTVQVHLFNVKAKKNVYSIEKSSNQLEDLYGFLESISNELFPIIDGEVAKYIDSKISIKKMISIEADAGYPLPIGDYLNIQIGAFSIGGGVNLTHRLFKNDDLSVYIRGSISNGFSFLFYNPKKIEGYFYEMNLSLPVSCVFEIKRTISIIIGTGFYNYFNLYQQTGVDGVTRVFFNYAPGISVNADFEIPLKINKQVLFGMKNSFNFIFYTGETANEIKPKYQYNPCFYFLYKMEN